MKAVFVFALLFGLLGSQAWAEEAGESSRFNWSRALEPVRAGYSALLLGPTLHNLDGNTDGRGSYITLRNYFSFGYEVAENWEVQSGWELRKYWRPVDPKNPGRSDFDGRDPYLALSRRGIVEKGVFSLGARARYFLPVSNYTKSKIGRVDDSGRGELNLSLYPQWKFFDGDLGFSCAGEIYYKFDKQAAANRENYSLKAKPQLSYRVNRKIAAKLEYDTGYFRHSNNGHWSKLNDRFTGHKLYAGVTYYPTYSLSVNPSLGWGSETFQLNRAEVSLYASYTFL